MGFRGSGDAGDACVMRRECQRGEAAGESVAVAAGIVGGQLPATANDPRGSG